MNDQDNMTGGRLTAFGEAEKTFRARHGGARIDAAEFQRKLTRCSTCRGVCCYDGASVDDETAAIVQQLSRARASDFADMGLRLPDEVVVKSEWRGVAGMKTATKPFPFRSMVDGYPAHFNETACVFLLEDGR
ncbi:MAG: hypothetical protein C5B56_15350, partial [Proteobacteria bacterium]